MLAEALGDQRFGVVEGHLAETGWRSLAYEAHGLHADGGLRPAGVGRGAWFRVAPEIRSDAVRWIDPAAPTRAQRRWLARGERLRRTLDESLDLGLFDYECHLARQGPGDACQTHLARFADASHRVVSLVLHPNDDWQEEDGGALRILREEPDTAPWVDASPRGGTHVAFLSGEIAHAVRPARRECLSLVG